MTWIDEEAYENMINALNNFVKQVTTHCEVMEKAGKDCEDNTQDPSAKTSNDKLLEHIKNIKNEFETVENVIKALEAELEKAREARKKAETAANQ